MGGGEGGKERKKKINILEVDADRVPFFFFFCLSKQVNLGFCLIEVSDAFSFPFLVDSQWNNGGQRESNLWKRRSPKISSKGALRLGDINIFAEKQSATLSRHLT